MIKYAPKPQNSDTPVPAIIGMTSSVDILLKRGRELFNNLVLYNADYYLQKSGRRKSMNIKWLVLTAYILLCFIGGAFAMGATNGPRLVYLKDNGDGAKSLVVSDIKGENRKNIADQIASQDAINSLDGSLSVYIKKDNILYYNGIQRSVAAYNMAAERNSNIVGNISAPFIINDDLTWIVSPMEGTDNYELRSVSSDKSRLFRLNDSKYFSIALSFLINDKYLLYKRGKPMEYQINSVLYNIEANKVIDKNLFQVEVNKGRVVYLKYSGKSLFSGQYYFETPLNELKIFNCSSGKTEVVISNPAIDISNYRISKDGEMIMIVARKYGKKVQPEKTYIYVIGQRSLRSFSANDIKHFPENRYVTNLDDVLNTEDVFYVTDRKTGQKCMIEKSRVGYVGIWGQ